MQLVVPDHCPSLYPRELMVFTISIEQLSNPYSSLNQSIEIKSCFIIKLREL